MKITIAKLLGYLLPAFMALAPQLNIPWLADPQTQASIAVLGPAITGILTNGFGGSVSAIFTTITGIIPPLVLILTLIFHLTFFTPAVIMWITIGATIAIAKMDKIADVPALFSWAIGKLFPNTKQLIPDSAISKAE